MLHRHVNSNPADLLAGHRCLPCLRGDDPDKRACALRRLMAEGLLPAATDKNDRPQ